MTEEVKTTQEGAENPTPEKTEEKTVSEIIGQGIEKSENQQQTVGLDKFLDIKKENKELKKQIQELAKRLDGGDDEQDVSDDIEKLADEHNIDKSFLNKLVNSVKTRTEQDIESRLNAKLAPLTEASRNEQIEKAFRKAFDETIEQMPEYKNVVNPEVIKALSLDPKNAKKTFSEIIEGAYGNAISGKRTIEKTVPGGGKEPQEIDYDKAVKDASYFKEIMDNPSLKKKYNDGLASRVARYL